MCSTQKLDSNTSVLSVPDVTVLIIEIYSKLSSLDTAKGPGDDGIPPLFLKYRNFSLSRPLFIIFNLSLSLGLFSARWKSSVITPILKSGDRSKVNNYRPVSLLNVLPKIFEQIIVERLTPFYGNFINDNQHGFVGGRSTTTNLAVLNSFISSALDDNSQVDAIYTDFSKTFDRVDHSTIIHKLQSFGLTNRFTNWIASYLSGRTQSVRILSRMSIPLQATSGVPQGRILDLFFLIYL